MQYDFTFKESLNDLIVTRSRAKSNQYISLDEIWPKSIWILINQRQHYINLIGYKFKTVNKRKILIDKQKNIISWVRFYGEYREYLQQNVKFIYLEETWLFENASIIQQWTLERKQNVFQVYSRVKVEGALFWMLDIWIFTWMFCFDSGDHEDYINLIERIIL